MTTISLVERPDLPELIGAKRMSGQLTAPREHAIFALKGVMAALGVKPSELCRLVGRRSDNSNFWASGTNAPSQAYWVRIAHIQSLALSGVDLHRIRTINWASTPFEIEWKRGQEPE